MVCVEGPVKGMMEWNTQSILQYTHWLTDQMTQHTELQPDPLFCAGIKSSLS